MPDCTNPKPAIPNYLEKNYKWAYIHPKAVSVFERKWLISLILFGNYSRLCDSVIDELCPMLAGRLLQIACVYGDLTRRIQQKMSKDSQLDIIDILPIQLNNLTRKLILDSRVKTIQCDSSALVFPDATYNFILLFFLLHEQPEDVRRKTLAEAVRVLKPGGKIVIVDYHRPKRWHPARPIVRGVFRLFEPFAIDLWQKDIQALLPYAKKPSAVKKTTYFGGLYQKLVLTY